MLAAGAAVGNHQTRKAAVYVPLHRCVGERSITVLSGECKHFAVVLRELYHLRSSPVKACSVRILPVVYGSTAIEHEAAAVAAEASLGIPFL